jgi:hypothetical protein
VRGRHSLSFSFSLSLSLSLSRVAIEAPPPLDLLDEEVVDVRVE